MKKMKHAISFVALVLMMVSMFSVCVFPAAAADEEYSILFSRARIVDPTWAGKVEGDPITVSFQGKDVAMTFDADWHFASYDEAWAYVETNRIADPVILLNAGEYSQPIEIKGAVTLLGSNAGIDPNEKSADKNTAWSLSADRSFVDASKETIFKNNIKIRASVGADTVVLDGLAFVDGGAILDHERDSSSSEFTVKNSIFNNAGNASSYYYGMYLRTDGHKRNLNLQNLYITGQNHISLTAENSNTPIVGFISPYFVELHADNIAYVENKAGFIAASWFADGVSPIVKVENSCFYNANASTPVGHIISIDNAYSNFDFNYVPAPSATNPLGSAKVPCFKNIEIGKDVNKRPNSMLELKDNIFYNASAKTNAYDPSVKGGVIHFQFVNSNSAVNMQGNYFYGSDGTSFMDSEFLLNSYLSDQTSCMHIRNNWFIGAYKVPDLTGSHADTYIDLTDNYFGRTNGEVVNFPVFTAEKAQRLIRTEFWVDMDLTVKNTGWNMTTADWSLAWVDNSTYDVELYMYTDGNVAAALPIKFLPQHSGLSVQLYKTAAKDEDGIPMSVSDPINKIDQSLLSQNVYEITTLYAKVTDPNNPYFAPIYTISVRNCGDLAYMPDFNSAFPGYLMAHPAAERLANGTFMPYRWNGGIYKMTVGKNLFSTAEEAIAYGYKQGQAIPTVCLPSGIYEDELVLPGSCTILGEKHGVNPNAKPYEYLTQDKFNSSEWTLSADRSILGEETIFYAPIRVAEGADDYVITVDGIMMGEGCSYVDDYARNADNITILKNLYALNAVGGYDRNGSANLYLFNFYKAYGPLTDHCSLYMYDCRVDGLDGEYLFGPYYEKLVVDGLFYARGRNKSYFFNNMQSRDIPDPYYSITNSYICDNAHTSNASTYTFTTRDDQGSQAVKENIIYLLDGNVFNNGFQTGYAAMQYWWPGTNMSVNLTNNTFYNTSNASFIAQTAGGIRYKGNCPTSDCSNILIIKGNRFIEMNRVPMTNGTGTGTNFDWSGNYWSTGINAGGVTPENINVIQPNESTGTYTYEECVRFTIDYTYADWDMKIRQYAADYTGEKILPETKASLSFSKGPYGTGTFSNEQVGGVQMPVYRDSGVSYEVNEYAGPAIVGEYDTVKYYTNAACTNEVAALNLTGTSNEFYGAVLPYGVTDVNADGVIKFKVIIGREVCTDADLLYFSNGVIDQANKSVFTETGVSVLNLSSVVTTLSPGATGKFYSDAACNSTVSMVRFSGGATQNTVYYKVVSSDGQSNVYTVNVHKSSVGTKGAVASIGGMTYLGNNVYQANVDTGVNKVTFTPEVYNNSTLAITNGSFGLTPDKGVYTLNMGNADQVTLKMVATSQDGKDSNTYTLKFIRKDDTSKVEILGIKGAAASSTGFGMSLGMNRVVDEIVVDVTPGATYAVYEDSACTKKLADGPFILNSESKIVYIKATAADGITSKIVRLTIYTSLMNYNAPIIKGKYGNTEKEALYVNKTDYELDLPAGVASVTLSSTFKIPVKDAEGKDITVQPKTGGEVKFYADPQLKVEIDAKSAIVLSQKITKVYYSMSQATYNITAKTNPNDKKPIVMEGNINERTGMITITSDRGSVSYSDKNAIPDWVTTYVNYLNNEKHGIFMGDQNKKLNASSNITRNEIATVATRVMGLDVAKYANVELNFADTVDAWALPYVRAAVGSGMINGVLDGTTGKTYFNGASNATREQVMKILVCVCMINEGISEDAAEYYKGHKNHVDMVYNEFDFVDEAKVSEWAVPYIHLAVGKYKLVGGSLDNGKLYLNPLKNVTRAEVIKMVACYMGHE